MVGVFITTNASNSLKKKKHGLKRKTFVNQKIRLISINSKEENDSRN
jgi:hypothetical protein